MKSLLAVVLFALIASINAKINTTNIPPISYLFSTFNNDQNAGLRIDYSTDGLNFEVLNDNKVLLTPKIGDKILRDPCILYGPDKIFHLVYTTSWKSKEIGYAFSKDLVHWSEEVLIPVMHHEPETENSWAPEVVWDEEKKHYFIFWSSRIKGKLEDRNHIYSTTTTDWKTFTPTKLFLSQPGISNIDATLLHDPDHNQWLMFVKEEESVRISFMKSKTLEGPYTMVNHNITPHFRCEGPTSVKIGNFYYVFVDSYFEHPNRMAAVRSSDLIHWENYESHVKFPLEAKHGTVFKVTPDVVELLSKAGL